MPNNTGRQAATRRGFGNGAGKTAAAADNCKRLVRRQRALVPGDAGSISLQSSPVTAP